MDLIPVGTPVLVMHDITGTIAGYGIDFDTGDKARSVYLVDIGMKGDYVANGRAYVRLLVVHPDNVVTENDTLTEYQRLLLAVENDH